MSKKRNPIAGSLSNPIYRQRKVSIKKPHNVEMDDDFDDSCPECGTQLRAKWSGVECPNPDCDYWFCY